MTTIGSMRLMFTNLPLDIRIEIYSFVTRSTWKLLLILGDLDGMKFFWYLNKPVDDELRPYEVLSRNGHIQALKWFHEQETNKNHRISWDEWTSAEAARGGNLNVLQYLRENNCPMNELCYSEAARGGHMHILRWLQEINCSSNTWSYIMAIQGGFYHVIQWLDSQQCPFNEWSFTWSINEDDYSSDDTEIHMLTCAKARGYNINDPPLVSTMAAQHGQLDILKWLKEKNLPWDEWTTAAAAYAGHLHILQWLRQHDCPWNHLTIKAAQDRGHDLISEWAKSQGCPRPRSSYGKRTQGSELLYLP